MPRLRRYTIFLLLIVFGFLSIQNIFFISHGSAPGNCQEFGHIHFYKFHTSARHPEAEVGTFAPASRSQADDEDENCHEAKSVLNVSPFPAAIFDLVLLIFPSAFQIVFHIENHFESPDLSPPRRPPRMA